MNKRSLAWRILSNAAATVHSWPLSMQQDSARYPKDRHRIRTQKTVDEISPLDEAEKEFASWPKWKQELMSSAMGLERDEEVDSVSK